MLYDSPCDEPGYYEREYPEKYHEYLIAKEEWELDEYLSKEDDCDELLEVNWECPR